MILNCLVDVALGEAGLLAFRDSRIAHTLCEALLIGILMLRVVSPFFHSSLC
jgi:hypothetical protein